MLITCNHYLLLSLQQSSLFPKTVHFSNHWILIPNLKSKINIYVYTYISHQHIYSTFISLLAHPRRNNENRISASMTLRSESLGRSLAPSGSTYPSLAWIWGTRLASGSAAGTRRCRQSISGRERTAGVRRFFSVRWYTANASVHSSSTDSAPGSATPDSLEGIAKDKGRGAVSLLPVPILPSGRWWLEVGKRMVMLVAWWRVYAFACVWGLGKLYCEPESIVFVVVGNCEAGWFCKR